MTDQPALFGGYEPPVQPKQPAETADRARTRRRLEQIRAGFHPLLVTLNEVVQSIHPKARRDADPTDERFLPYTCGSCVFQRRTGWRNGYYLKCGAADGARMTHGPGTDIRLWWPACPDYQPHEKEGPTP